MDWFNSLQQYTKEDWLKEIRKDNPNSFDGILEHRVMNKINGLSFATKEDITNIPTYDDSIYRNQEWLIGTSIQFSNAFTTKELITHCLNNGVEHLIIQCDSTIQFEDIAFILKDVFTELIKFEFRFTNENISTELVQYIRSKNCSISQTANISKTDSTIIQLYIVELVNIESVNLKNIIDTKNARIILKCTKDFLTNIAIIRALLKAFRYYNITIPIEASISVESNEKRNNFIDYSIIALSAAIENTYSIIVAPHFDSLAEQDQLLKNYKQFLHLQHILKSESFLNKKTDPIKGSYYIEDLSHKIYSKLIS